MTRDTVITYESKGGSVRFAVDTNFWIEEVRGLETDVTTATSQSVDQRGESLDAKSIGAKSITVSGWLLGDVEVNRARLLATILPAESARLTFTDNGESWYLDGTPTKTPIMGDGSKVQSFQFNFFAPYPFLRSTKQETYTLTGITPMWHTPFFTGGTHWISKFTEDMFAKIQNTGNVAQSFVVEFYATSRVICPVLHNVNASTFIRTTKTFEAGDKLRISTHQQDKDDGNGVLFFGADGTTTNGFRLITPDSDLDMQIPPGGCICMADADEYKHNLRCTLITAGGEKHSL